MSLYFILHDAVSFNTLIRPRLAESWRRRRFEPCQELCAKLAPIALSFTGYYHSAVAEPLVSKVLHGIPFDRDLWRILVGEVLLFAAAELPQIQTAPNTLFALLSPERYTPDFVTRESYVPIQQAHFGSRELTFGGAYYRPDYTGWNDSDDVIRLVDYLVSIDPNRWTADDLAVLIEFESVEDREEELEFVREWFPELRELYQRARINQQIVVCEVL